MGPRRQTIATLFAVAMIAGACGSSDPPANVATTSTSAAVADVEPDFAALGAELEQLRQLLRIPGLAAAVVLEEELVWSSGFGHADIQGDVPATPDTPFHLASVTKPIASTMLMQLVEEGLVDLDAPVADFGIELDADGPVLVRHLLTHTSSGVPGERHLYDGDRFGLLGTVIESATGRPFAEVMFDRIIGPAGMTHSTGGDGRDCDAEPSRARIDVEGDRVRSQLARPYQLDLDFGIVESLYPEGYSPAAGLVASVTDIAAFDIALDRGQLVRPASVEAMFEPLVPTLPPRTDLAYGLGWYSQTFDGTRLVWHSGRWPPSVSALYLKVPEHGLTFVVAGNTPNLTTPFPLGSGDAMTSAPALAFHRHVLFPLMHSERPPPVDWTADDATLLDALTAATDPAGRSLLRQEMWARRQAAYSVGLDDEFERLERLYRSVFADSSSRSAHLLRASADAVLLDGVELTSAELDAYTGTYRIDLDASTWPEELGPPPDPVRIERRDGELAACSADSPPSRLVPLGDHEFQATGGPTGSFMIIAIVDGGRVVGLRAPIEIAEIGVHLELVYGRDRP